MLTATAAMLATGCATPDRQPLRSSNTCDKVVQELDGFGNTREQALDDAIASAVKFEFGASVSSEMVLEGNELVVNRQSEVYRGLVDSAIAIGLPNGEEGSDGITLPVRVTLCRNNVLPNQRTTPSSIVTDGQMTARTQAMLDVSDTQANAGVKRKKEFANYVSSLLSPVTGRSLHVAQVTSYNATNVIATAYYSDTPIGQSSNLRQSKSVSFSVKARVSLEPEVRENLEQLLDTVAMRYHTPHLFGLGYKGILQKHGFAFVDQRLEQHSNPALHRSDRYQTSWLDSKISQQARINDITIIRGLFETRADDAKVLAQNVSDAIGFFVQNGLTLVGWSEQQTRIVEIPLFENTGNNAPRVERMALYPESADSRRQESNGAIFERPRSIDKAWIARQITPLKLLPGKYTNTPIPALRRGAIELEIDVVIARNASTRINRFTLESTPPSRVSRISRGLQ